jgi:hypothetical protein
MDCALGRCRQFRWCAAWPSKALGAGRAPARFPFTSLEGIGGFVTLLAVGLLATGCGTIMGGRSQVVTFNTTPAGASVTTVPPSGDGTTPTVLKLSRKQRYTITFSMPGYQSAKVDIDRKFRPGIVAADVALCCLAPIIDAITGGWYKLTPSTVNVNLTRMAATSGPDDILVEVALDETQEGADLQVHSSVPGVHIEVIRRE